MYNDGLQLNTDLLEEDFHLMEEDFQTIGENAQAETPAPETDSDESLDPALELDIPAIGRNCRINISDKREIVRLTEELKELQRWFEQYGQDGVLFPHSIINSFEPRSQAIAA